MPGFYLLDDNHEPYPVELLDWARWFEKNDRHVGNTVLNGVQVSTVFLGLDHSWSVALEHVPVLFETMIFGGDLDGEMQRCCTWGEALEVHRAMCRAVLEAMNDQTTPVPEPRFSIRPRAIDLEETDD